MERWATDLAKSIQGLWQISWFVLCFHQPLQDGEQFLSKYKMPAKLMPSQPSHTLKTSMLTEDGDSIFKLLRRVSHPEIKFCRVNYELWWKLLFKSGENCLLSYSGGCSPPGSISISQSAFSVEQKPKDSEKWLICPRTLSTVERKINEATKNGSVSQHKGQLSITVTFICKIVQSCRGLNQGEIVP